MFYLWLCLLTLFSLLCCVCRNGNSASVELFDTSSEVADININTVLRSLVIPDAEMVPVLPKVLTCMQFNFKKKLKN